MKKEKDYFFELNNNYQTHLVDVMFLYSFNNEIDKYSLINKNEFAETDVKRLYERKNKFLENIRIEAIQETLITSFDNIATPNLIILNYQDWGYFSWVIDNKSLEFLKRCTQDFDIENLFSRFKNDFDVDQINNYVENNQSQELRKFYEYNDKLTKSAIFRGLYDLVVSRRLKAYEFLSLSSKLVLFMKNENMVKIHLKRMINISDSLSSYDMTNTLNMNFSYKDQVFELIYFMLRYAYMINEKNKSKNEKEIDNKNTLFKDKIYRFVDKVDDNFVIILFKLFLKICWTENHYNILLSWYMGEKDQNGFLLDLKKDYLYPLTYLKTLTKIFKSQNIESSLKLNFLSNELNNIEINSFVNEIKPACLISIPEKENKIKYYEAIVTNKDNISLHELKYLMKNFFSSDQKDLVDELMNRTFFSVYERILEKDDMFLSTYFVNNLSPFNYNDKNLMKNLFLLVEKIQNHDVGVKILLNKIEKILSVQQLMKFNLEVLKN